MQHNQINNLYPSLYQNDSLSYSNQDPSNGEEQEPGSDIIGVIKIKDGIFICDEFGAQVK
jgi:hypothetical protein